MPTTPLDGIHAKATSDIPINQLCVPQTQPNVPPGRYTPRITIYGNILDNMKGLYLYRGCGLWERLWMDCSADATPAFKTIQEVSRRLYPQCNERMKNVYKNLKSGDLSFDVRVVGQPYQSSA